MRAKSPTAPRYKASQTSGCGPILGTGGIDDASSSRRRPWSSRNYLARGVTTLARQQQSLTTATGFGLTVHLGLSPRRRAAHVPLWQLGLGAHSARNSGASFWNEKQHLMFSRNVALQALDTRQDEKSSPATGVASRPRWFLMFPAGCRAWLY